MTTALAKLVAAFLTDPTSRRYGLDLMRDTGSGQRHDLSDARPSRARRLGPRRVGRRRPGRRRSSQPPVLPIDAGGRHRRASRAGRAAPTPRPARAASWPRCVRRERARPHDRRAGTSRRAPLAGRRGRLYAARMARRTRRPPDATSVECWLPRLAPGRIRVKPGIRAVQRRRWPGSQWLAAAVAVEPGRAAVRCHARYRAGGDGCRARDERTRVPSLDRQRLAIATSAIGPGNRHGCHATPGPRDHRPGRCVACPSIAPGAGYACAPALSCALRTLSSRSAWPCISSMPPTASQRRVPCRAIHSSRRPPQRPARGRLSCRWPSAPAYVWPPAVIGSSRG